MGYRVICYPFNGPSGYLDHGKVMKTGYGTWYTSPSAATNACLKWVGNNPKSFGQVVTHDDALVQEYWWRP
jgi:hypothetical protein